MVYSLIDLFCGVIAPLTIVLVIFGIFGKAGMKKIIWVVLFTFYLAEMFDIAGVPYIQYMTFTPIINIIPFGDLFKDESTFWVIFQFLANIVLFVPFGMFLPVIWENFRHLPITAVAGALLSLAIEVIQLFSFRVTAIDDLLMNTLGTVIGYLVAEKLLKKRWGTSGVQDKSSIKRNTMEMLAVIGLTFASAIFLKGTISNFIYSLPMFG